MPVQKTKNHRPLTYPFALKNGAEAVTLSGDLDITGFYGSMLSLDPGGADRNVDIDETSVDLLWRPFWLYNAANADEEIAVRNSSDSTIATLARGESCVVVGDGTTLHLVGKTQSLYGSGGTVATYRPAAAQQSLSGAGAVNITTYNTAVTTTGADALTLADGAQVGQEKRIQMIVDGGDGTLTPSNLSGGTTITFADVGDVAELKWDGTNWVAVALYNIVDGATAPVLA